MTDDQDQGQIVVEDDPAESRYQITVDGQLAGIALYEGEGDRRTFVHTEIDSDFEGRGLGGRLAAAALADVRARHLSVVPVCPFIASYLRRHPEQWDLVEEPYRSELASSSSG